MGFLTRFLSLRRKDKPAKGDRKNTTPSSTDTVGQETPALVIASRFTRDADKHPKYSTSRSVGSMDILRPRIPSMIRENEHKDARPAPRTDDGEIEINRLLRSSSTHFKAISQADYEIAPKPSQATNTASSRSTLGLSTLTPGSGTIGSKGSYSVKIHKRQQHSATEFPNAYPPVTPLRPTSALAQRSTPNLLHKRSGSLDGVPVQDPRKIPFTPKDLGRLTRLRQDPSVVSLLQMYDDEGKIDDQAFRNTPMPAKVVSRKRTKSTFQELLGGEGASKADLAWAESCLNGESSSSAGSTSNSTITSPPAEASPSTSFDESPKTTASSLLAKKADLTVSSMVVELSVDLDNTPDNSSQEIECKTPPPSTPKRAPNATPARIMRTPSKRASQVFNFIGDRRERRRSMDLLQADVPSLADTEVTTTTEGTPTPATPPPVPPKTSMDWRSRKGSALSSSSRDSLDGPSNTTAIVRSASALGYFNTRFSESLISAPPSPEVFRPLNPPPRPRNRSIGPSTALRTATNASTASSQHRSSRNSTESTIAPPVPSSAQFEKPKEKKKRSGIHEEWRGPTTSTPRAPRTAKGPRGPRDFPSMGNDENAEPSAVPRPPTANARTRRKKSFSQLVPGEARPVAMVDASFERKYSTFAASLEKETMVLVDAREKVNRRISGRKRGSLADLGLVRATSAASSHLFSKVQTKMPLSPSRSQSVRQY